MRAASIPSVAAAAPTGVLTVEIDGSTAWITFNRPEKRNAVNDALLEALGTFFTDIPDGVRVVVVKGAGGHFSSGLDLAEQSEREADQVLRHSRG